jgi:hypothetical protein
VASAHSGGGYRTVTHRSLFELVSEKIRGFRRISEQRAFGTVRRFLSLLVLVIAD